jgi:hypothetical protein
MSKQPRVVKVLAALLVSMTVGAFVLMALGNNPPSAGPFCLAPTTSDRTMPSSPKPASRLTGQH